MRPGVRAVGLAVVAVAGAAACGGSPGPAATVEKAIGSHDPSRCDLYTDAFFQREAGTNAAAARSYCRRVTPRLPAVHPRISSVSQHGNTAVVAASASGRTVVYRLVRENGRWLIDKLVS
jgi:hypothetical protein